MTAQAVRDPLVILATSKVKPQIIPEWGDERGTPPVEIEIKLNDGRAFKRLEKIPKGNPLNPMSWRDLCDTFNDCIKHGRRPLARDMVEKATGLLADLEKIDDIRELIRKFG